MCSRALHEFSLVLERAADTSLKAIVKTTSTTVRRRLIKQALDYALKRSVKNLIEDVFDDELRAEISAVVFNAEQPFGEATGKTTVAADETDEKLAASILARGIDTFLDFLPENLWRKIGNKLCLDLPEIPLEAKALISDEIMLQGIEDFVKGFSRKTLCAILSENFFISKKVAKLKSDEALVESFMTNTFKLHQNTLLPAKRKCYPDPKEMQNKDGETVPKAKKRKIHSGKPEKAFVLTGNHLSDNLRGFYEIVDGQKMWKSPPTEGILTGVYTAGDLNDNFLLHDLVKFCADHSVMYRKKKKNDLIRAILREYPCDAKTELPEIAPTDEEVFDTDEVTQE